MKALFLAALLSLTVLSGCIGDTDDPDHAHGNAPYSGDGRALVETIQIPDGATMTLGEGGPILEWLGAGSPFQAEFTLPDGATMVRFVADAGDDESVSVSMWNSDTGRRRCNQQTVEGFGQGNPGPRSCSSIAAVDLPGTNWTVRATTSAPAAGLLESPQPAPSIDARIEFYSEAPDGPAAGVAWDKLSKATYDIQPTVGQYITAHDGTQLWVEVTLPIGEGPWPTVIAASPYNGQAGRIPDPGEGGGTVEGTPAMWRYWTQDYAKRGYAAVNVDVRGFGKSGGCVEVWGINEQLDQKLIVDWVADQAWSNGRAGFYGQSYVATTPVAAAVQAPDALKAIIAVAPVIDAYHDWHYGGVPNGESSLSPVAYQALVDVLGINYLAQELTPENFFPTDLATFAQYAVKGICDPTLIPLANDPRAIHGDYYDERDFGARAGDIEAAVLFTQGFEDANVKSAMIPDWFNAIEAPKLGVFGHWLHQHPARMDAEALFLGWMDEFVKEVDLGLAAAYPNVVVSVDDATHRRADSWPAEADEVADFALNFGDGSLSREGGSTSVPLDLTPLPVDNTQGTTVGPLGVDEHVLTSDPLESDLHIAHPALRVRGSIEAPNAFLYARLDAIHTDGSVELLTWGMKNLGHGDDEDSFTPFTYGAQVNHLLEFRPTELIVPAGASLQLTLRGVDAGEAVGVAQPNPGTMTLSPASELILNPVAPQDAEPMPLTALP